MCLQLEETGKNGWKDEEEEGGKKKGGGVGGRGGQMCTQVPIRASGWRCEAVQRGQTEDRQAAESFQDNWNIWKN